MDPASTHEFIVLWTLAGSGSAWRAGGLQRLLRRLSRMQSIVVTLSTMFIVQGVTLLVMEKPGGTLRAELRCFFSGNAIPNLLPTPVAADRVRLAGGSGEDRPASARRFTPWAATRRLRASAGIRVGLCGSSTYMIAGGFYGRPACSSARRPARRSAGRQADAAVRSLRRSCWVARCWAAGEADRTRLDLRRLYSDDASSTSCWCSMFPPIIRPVAEGVILILAVLAASLKRRLRTCAAATPDGRALFRVARRHAPAPNRRWRSAPARSPREEPPRSSANGAPPCWAAHADALRYAVPSYVCFVAVVVVTDLWLGSAVLHWSYCNSLIVLSSFLAILALGQGTAILTGGLDLCRSLDDRPFRHPARRHGARLRQGADLCVAGRVRDRPRLSASSMASASWRWEFRPSS